MLPSPSTVSDTVPLIRIYTAPPRAVVPIHGSSVAMLRGRELPHAAARNGGKRGGKEKKGKKRKEKKKKIEKKSTKK